MTDWNSFLLEKMFCEEKLRNLLIEASRGECYNSKCAAIVINV